MSFLFGPNTSYNTIPRPNAQFDWAYFFLYFKINVSGVSLLPTFVGYLLFLGAISLLENEERELSLLRPFAILLGIWHGLDWFLSFLRADLYGLQFIDLIRNKIDIYFHFQLLTNLAAIARRYQPEGMELDRKLLKYRTLQTLMITVICILGYFSKWLPNTAHSSPAEFPLLMSSQASA